ncbi:MAG TPA: hypothetical protein VF228_06180 [Iamia sp.]
MSRPGGLVRRTAAAVLVVLAWIALALAPVAVWARAQVLETDRWVAVAAPLSREPVVRTALADWATDQLVVLVRPEALLRRALPDRADPLSIPLAGAVTDFVHDRVTVYLRSDEFSELWATAVARGHRAALRLLEGEVPAVTAGTDSVTINLLPLLQRVLDRITTTTPELFGREIDLPDVDIGDVPSDTARALGEALGVDVPDDLGQITVYDRGRLRAAQDGLRRLGRLVTLVVALAVLLPIAALALSPRRGRTAMLLVGGALVGAVLVRRVIALGEDEVLARIRDSGSRAVAARLIDRLVEPLTLALGWVVAVSALILAVAYLTSSRPGAARVRALCARGPRAAGRVVLAHRQVAQIGVAVLGVAALLLLDLGWLATVLLIAAVGGGVWALSRGPGPLPPPPAPG